MRPLGVSKLDPHRNFIEKLVSKGNKPPAIRRELRRIGCSVSLSHLYNWIGGVKLLRQGVCTNSGLSLLGSSGDYDIDVAKLRILKFLFEPDRAWTTDDLRRILGPGTHDVPFTGEGEPDFAGFAIALGKKRVRSFGDTDFVILALWTREIRTLLQSPIEDSATAWVTRSRQIIRVARKIRDEMHSAKR